MLSASALEHTAWLWEGLRRGLREPSELYRREVERLRIERRGADVAIIRGVDRGLAVRLVDGDGVRFASASGDGPDAVRWAVAAARRLPPVPRPTAPWERSAPAAQLDEEEGAAVPEPDVLLRAIERLEGISATIEVALVVETLAAEGGLQALRSRVRWWAAVESATSRRSWAGRRIAQIAPGPPETTAAAEAAPPVPLRHALEVPAHAAGPLVAALVRAVHGPATEPFPVGDGWRVRDDPLDADAPSGGRFDDAGFRTRGRILADGVCGSPLEGGPGSLWRGSFREPPVPRPVNLVVEPTGDRPRRRIVAERVRFDPLAAGTWALRVHGRELDRDQPCGAPGEWIARVTPRALVEGCVAAVGTAHRGTDGVVCPGLVFELPAT